MAANTMPPSYHALVILPNVRHVSCHHRYVSRRPMSRLSNRHRHVSLTSCPMSMTSHLSSYGLSLMMSCRSLYCGLTMRSMLNGYVSPTNLLPSSCCLSVKHCQRLCCVLSCHVIQSCPR